MVLEGEGDMFVDKTVIEKNLYPPGKIIKCGRWRREYHGFGEEYNVKRETVGG